MTTTWPEPAPADAAAVAEFWQREHALEAADDAAKRMREVVLYARTASGDIAGVATAVPMVPPRFGQPLYYFRAFVGSAWRTTRLARALVVDSCAVLEAYARERGFPCIGVLLELENARFDRTLRLAAWRNPRFYYAGKSLRGLDVRVFYFQGARLKSPAELQAMRFSHDHEARLP